MSSLGDDGRRGSRLRSSHLSLLDRCAVGGAPGDIDAIVVPTHRSTTYLGEAIELGGQLDCPVLVLCSGRSRAAEAAGHFGATAGAAVTVSSTPRHSLLAFGTQRNLSSLAEPYLDTANKRNVGLLLGRLLGWNRLLFLDDDIRGLTSAQVRGAAAVLGSGDAQVASWRFPDFADNSVACHALRSSGQPQDVFIGAGALLVELTGWLPFFPAVYNEDWLFWHDFAVRREVCWFGDVKQIGYDPFADPHRARQQEFGDVLAEGIYALIHERRSALVACLPGYWGPVINERREMLAGIDRRLWRLRRYQLVTRNGYEIASVLRAVAASREVLETVTPHDLAEFTSLWRSDLYRWNARLHQLPRFSRIVDALGWLGITDVYPADGI
jgi:hypothetical protein